MTADWQRRDPLNRKTRGTGELTRDEILGVRKPQATLMSFPWISALRKTNRSRSAGNKNLHLSIPADISGSGPFSPTNFRFVEAG